MSTTGLSSAHSSTAEAGKASITRQGHVLKVTLGEAPSESATRRGGGKRSRIRGFSRQAARRLQLTICKVDPSAPALEVGLTFMYPTKGDEAKRALRNLFRRIKRVSSNVSMVWKLEPNRLQSGPYEGCLTCHFHAVVWGSDLREIKKRIPQMWGEVVKQGPDHLKAGAHIAPIRSTKKFAFYLRATKGRYREDLQIDELGYCGDRWGVLGRKDLPIAPVEAVRPTGTTDELVEEMSRVLGPNFIQEGTQSITCIIDHRTAPLVTPETVK